MINRTFVLLAIMATTIGAVTAPKAQMAIADEQSPCRFQLEQTESHRGLAVQGHLGNGLPWRITNVRLRVDSIDTNEGVIASASGWVLGDVRAGNRAYFYVSVSAPAGAYRASVQAFDTVAPEAHPRQAP